MAVASLKAAEDSLIHEVEDRRADGSSLYFRSKGLFEKHFVENKLDKISSKANKTIHTHWTQKGDVGNKDFDEAFREVEYLWEKYGTALEDMNESDLEDKWVRPILKLLGWEYDTQTSYRRNGRLHKPDYVLFQNWDVLNEVKKSSGTDTYFDSADAVGDAKAWGVPLDGASSSNEHPSAQIVRYMETAKVGWGILTDGRYWRLYSTTKNTSHRVYYEIDLLVTLTSNNHQAFRFFYNFFSKSAFTPDNQGLSFLEHVLKQGMGAARQIEQDLKKRAFQVVENICVGFIGDERDLEDQDLNEIYHHSLVLLFRMMFILNCEAKRILDVNDRKYGKYSLQKLAEEILAQGPNADWGESSRTYRSVLDTIRISRDGDKRIGIQGFGAHVFSGANESFYKEWEVPDWAMNNALIRLATFEEDNEIKFIDYESLANDHLGSIFEGLLENQVEFADQDYVVVNDKLRKWSELKDKQRKKYKNDIIKEGSPLLKKPDSNDRRASGSFYTPDYVVSYINKKTIESKIRDLTLEEILKLKICDPAMGSGHFLLGALSTLESIALEKSEESKSAISSEITNQIITNCLYGVDKNPIAVELAKFSIWITISGYSDELIPLDAQLYCGDSLIDDLDDYEFNFDWHKEILNPLQIDGFDFVVGNPPYSYRKSTLEKFKPYYKEKYQCTEGNYDVYKFFVERCVDILKPGGTFGMILNSSFLIQKSFTKLRSILLDKTSISEIDMMGGDVFEEATVDTAIMFFENIKGSKTSKLPVKVLANPKDVGTSKPELVSISRFRENENFAFDCRLSDVGADLLERVQKQSGIIEDFYDVGVGINTGYIKSELTASKKVDRKYHKMVKGTGISRFGSVETDGYIMYDPDFVKSKGDRGRALPNERFFNQDKILVVRTRNISLSQRIVATVDSDKCYNLNRLSNIVPKGKSNIFACLGVINSTFFRWIFSTRFFDYEIKPVYLKRCPFPNKTIAQITKLVKKRLKTEDKALAAEIDRDIDLLVYESFKLSKKDIEIIESDLVRFWGNEVEKVVALVDDFKNAS